MLNASSRIWTLFALSISFDYYHYTKSTHMFLYSKERVRKKGFANMDNNWKFVGDSVDVKVLLCNY